MMAPIEAARAKPGRIDVERTLAGVRGAAGAEHDTEGEDIRRGDEERDAEQDEPSLPALILRSPSQSTTRARAVNVKP